MSDPKPSERDALHAKLRELGYTTHGQTTDILDVVFSHFAATPAGEQAQPVAQWPIARLTVSESDQVTATLYSPGLPPGSYDVWLAPAPSAQPMTWQPIETAPKDRKVLLWGFFWNGRSKFSSPLIGLWSPHDNEWCVPGEFRFKVKPTHWKPLDEPPTE